MNGIVTHEDTVYQSTAMYMCNSGFTLTDGNSQRTCDINGDWTGEEPTCSKLFQCQYMIMPIFCVLQQPLNNTILYHNSYYNNYKAPELSLPHSNYVYSVYT